MISRRVLVALFAVAAVVYVGVPFVGASERAALAVRDLLQLADAAAAALLSGWAARPTRREAIVGEVRKLLEETRARHHRERAFAHAAGALHRAGGERPP